MRLLKVGRDASCDIVLHSDKVSSLHAEITVLNNGDILLEDKNSHNGTYVMNKPIKPGASISIRRGDAIRFADVELMWSQIPATEDNSKFKALYGIGTNYRNDLQVSGNTVSRFHATLKIGKDGKAYIQDHSKNGTTVNGSRIPFGQNVQIKRNDSLVCGGVPVDVKRFLPRPSVLTKIAAVVAACCVVVAVVFGVKNLNIERASLEDLQNATACVYGQYYIEVAFEDDPFQVLAGEVWPKKWIFGKNKSTGKIELEGDGVAPIRFTGTAFFISDNGELGTNRHIAAPWENITKEEENQIRLSLQKSVNNLEETILVEFMRQGVLSQEDAVAYYSRIERSPIKISGRFDYLGIALTGTNFTTISDLLSCQVIALSESKEQDVALLRLNSRETPKHIVESGYYDITNALVDETKLKPQEELITIGYPNGFNLGFSTAQATELRPTIHRAYVSKNPDKNSFQFQGQGVGGQSGSPIVDKSHKLVGVLYGGYANTDFTYGCNIKHLVELYNQHKIGDK